MGAFSLFVTILFLCGFGFLIGRLRSRQVAFASGGLSSLHSLPTYYASMVAYWCAIPAVALLLVWISLDERVIQAIVLAALPAGTFPDTDSGRQLIWTQIVNLANGTLTADDPAILLAAERVAELRQLSSRWMTALVLMLSLTGIFLAWRRIKPQFKARIEAEFVLRTMLLACSMIAILTTLGIVLSVLFESIRFFQRVPFWDFLTGIQWSPQTAIREDQVGASGSFGAIPLFVGTLQISFVAMCVAVPVGLMSAIYLAEYASARVRGVAKPVLEILAGIPTVVYGFFAALTVAPQIREWGEALGFTTSSESALAAGLVMGIMIIPFISSLSDDVINAVPQSLRDGSYGLGATQSETIRRVIFPAALPGIVGGILLAVSRAIGETMIVVMAAGLAANLTANPLEAVTTVTVQIVTLLVGDQEFDSAKTLAAFALGLILFLITLGLNIIALWVVNRYREQYE